MKPCSITFSNSSLYRPDTSSIPKLMFQCTTNRNCISNKTTTTTRWTWLGFVLFLIIIIAIVIFLLTFGSS